MKLAYIAILPALFLSPRAEEKPAAPAPEPTNVEVAAAQPEVLPIGAVVEAPASNPAPEVAIPELPADMRVVVSSKGAARTLSVVHQGHLITLRRGDTVVLGDNTAMIPIKDGAQMTWESSDRQTFETLRGVVEWEVQPGKREMPQLRATARVMPMREVSAAKHECKAFEGTNDAISVLCRIDSLGSGAARTFGNKPQEGIAMTETGEHRYFRMDLDPSKNEIDSVVLGYTDGIRGHVIRAEASKLPGETKASFSLVAAARIQPARIIRRFPRHPHDEILFFE